MRWHRMGCVSHLDACVSSVLQIFAGEPSPEGTDGVLVGDAVVRIVGLGFGQIPQEVDAEVAVEIIVFNMAGLMGIVMGGGNGPDAGGQLHVDALLIPGFDTAEGLLHPVGILGGACKVSLYLDSNSKMKAKRSSTRFEALMQNMEELDGKIKEHCVGRMLKAANEWKENEDDPDITADQFKENMGAPFELIVQSGGKLEIYYGDGDMFGGHAIFVNVNTRNEIVRCELVG